MTPELPAWIWTAVSWGATYLLHSSLLIVGVWCGLRIRPAIGHGTRETLWKMALVGGVLTSLLQTVWLTPPWGRWSIELGSAAPLSDSGLPTPAIDSENSFDALFSTESPGAADPLLAQTGSLSAGRSEPNLVLLRSLRFADTNRSPDTTAPSAVVLPEIGSSASKRTIPLVDTTAPALWPSADQRQRLTWSFAGLGMLAVAWGVGRALQQSLNLHRRLANCVPVTGGLAHELLADLRARTPGCPEVLLLTSDEEHEPAAFGLFRWTILLPERAERELSSAELRTLLAHELAHLVRGDAVWLTISRLCCSCLAFQPLNQLARREWQKSAEFLSDAWAVDHTGQPLALARCLTEVAGWRLAPGQPLAALAATGRRSGLAERVERLLQDGRAANPGEFHGVRRRTWLLCLGLLVLLAWGVPRLSLRPALANELARETVDMAGGDSAQGDVAEETAEPSPPDSEFQIARFGFSTIEIGVEEESPAVLLLRIEVSLEDLDREMHELQTLVVGRSVPSAVQMRLQKMQWTVSALAQQRGLLRRLIRQDEATTGAAP